jgi:hypothetical protein
MENVAPGLTDDQLPVDSQAKADEDVSPPACPILSQLYGKKSFPKVFWAKDVPVSSVIAACWPASDAKVCSKLVHKSGVHPKCAEYIGTISNYNMI